MSRWMVFLPLGVLLLAGGLMALFLGKRAATTSETEVIEQVADRYVREAGAGARRSDCAGCIRGALAGGVLLRAKRNRR